MILNIHGYKGDRENTMYRILRDLFSNEKIVSPQLDYDAVSPITVKKAIESLVTDEIELIAGTSLGGFFALSLWAKHNTIPAILFNPAFAPWTVLQQLGFGDDNDDEFKTILGEACQNPGYRDRLHILLGKHDELLGDTSNIIIESGLCQPINIRKLDCGHSASDNPKAVTQIKKAILTLRNSWKQLTVYAD